jgi:hypothetical protein
VLIQLASCAAPGHPYLDPDAILVEKPFTRAALPTAVTRALADRP